MVFYLLSLSLLFTLTQAKLQTLGAQAQSIIALERACTSKALPPPLLPPTSHLVPPTPSFLDRSECPLLWARAHGACRPLRKLGVSFGSAGPPTGARKSLLPLTAARHARAEALQVAYWARWSLEREVKARPSHEGDRERRQLASLLLMLQTKAAVLCVNFQGQLQKMQPSSSLVAMMDQETPTLHLVWKLYTQYDYICFHEKQKVFFPKFK
ncbi:hypothetical protein Cni_G05496 [Canna indica]|uniref:Uncharacterized protein n=1 Tax=Canna indica TaxID=4628 RepID=A0AAQ3Q5J5_9LILI|nr:hypothetical protein Cni_G05496 [Canna indica]